MIPTRQEYEARELSTFSKSQAQLERNSTKEDRAEFAAIIKSDPALVADRCGWILNGSYGFAPYYHAKNVASNKRMNRPAWFVQMIALIEWGCNFRGAVAAYKALTPEEQTALNDLVMREIDGYLAEAE